jgi:hypothetical protein
MGRLVSVRLDVGNIEPSLPASLQADISLCHCGVESKRGRIQRMRHSHRTMGKLTAEAGFTRSQDNYERKNRP